jgi:hypothetical protein
VGRCRAGQSCRLIYQFPLEYYVGRGSLNQREGLFMASLEAHYSARDIEARILAAVRAAALNPEQRLY